MNSVIKGQDLIDAGMKPGKWFSQALANANALLENGGSLEQALETARSFEPPPFIQRRAADTMPFHMNIKAESPEEIANIEAVRATMTELMRTPVVCAGAMMPDACPAGSPGTIPVGGVVASEGIHPGMHSADVCCSMALSIFPGVSPSALLDAVGAATHFGPGGRPSGQQFQPSAKTMALIMANPMLRPHADASIGHFGTQGDGNHFAYVGIMKSSGETALVTHHGSRAPGARLYKAGMEIAERHRKILSPDTLAHNAWIPGDSKDGEIYWDALQTVRSWTKESHFLIHDLAAQQINARISDRFWNEHNFVFRKSDGLFYHAKGATPAFDGWAEDATGLTIIPLNMAQPILIVRGRNAPHGLGFSPHGAGRNLSRTQHKRNQKDRTIADILAEETKGIDLRFFSNVADVSELPSAYKNADSVRTQIARYGLADPVDEVLPYGCIMAGDWESTAPWRLKKKEKAGATM